jgi:hypothetical protein
MLEMASTHKAAEIDTHNLPPESLEREPVEDDEIRDWHRRTLSLASRLDLPPQTRESMLALAEHVNGLQDWPARYIRPAKLPSNSKARRALRVTILLWGLEHLRRAGEDVEGRAKDGALWRTWREQLFALFDGMPDDVRPKVSDGSLDNRFQRFENEWLQSNQGAALMAQLLNTAIPIAIRRASQFNSPAPASAGVTHPTQ